MDLNWEFNAFTHQSLFSGQNQVRNAGSEQELQGLFLTSHQPTEFCWKPSRSF